METNSVNSLLEWLQVQPRTYGWGAVMAYGRSETNKVLRQEYITRFSTNDYIRKITEEILDNTTPTQKEFLHEYQMDAPRLSFRESNLGDAAAKLTMQVVGGTHLTFSKPVGNPQWSISRISLEDVLDGPQLLFDIDLLKSTGTVTSAGNVILDISKGTNYRLTYVQTEHLRRVAGQRMQQIFSALPDGWKQFPLNELKFEPDQFIKPSRFEIRTHNKKDSGAKLLANEDEGEGAVLVFVAMVGDVNGTLPADNKDLKYLLPDGFTATVLLGHEFFFKKMFVEGLKKITNAEEIKFETIMSSDGKKIQKIIGLSGSRVREVPASVVVQGVNYAVQRTFADIHVKNSSKDDVFEMDLVGGRNPYILWREIALDMHFQTPSDAGVHLEWELLYMLDLNVEDGVLALNYIAEKSEIGAKNYTSSIPQSHRENLSRAITSWMVTLFDEGMSDFVQPLKNINILTLNSLLFRGENAVKLEEVHYPSDLALFGHVGPSQTAFSITQLEPVIGQGEKLQFTTEPPRTGLTWKVENIVGETVPVGTITSEGEYTAPTGALLKGKFARVKVTASAGGHTSSALVTVMPRGITVNPIIQVATAGDPLALDVSAGAVDGGPLTWSIQDPTSGAVVRPNPAEGGDHSYVPGPKKADTMFSVDKLVVRNPRTNVSDFAQVLVIHKPALLTLLVDSKANLPANKVQLVVAAETGNLDPKLLTWNVLLGGTSAVIDETTGVLTVNPDGVDSFVVVTVRLPSPMPGIYPDLDGYIILPLPLFSVPETIRMLSADGQ